MLPPPIQKPSKMEVCPKGFGTLSQLFSETVSETKTGGWHFSHSIQRADIICPEPRRASRIPFVVDGINRFSCMAKSLNIYQRDTLEMLDIILTKDDLEGDSDASDHAGFFCGSPPVRSGNPQIHDVEFVKQSLSVASPLGNTHGGKASPRLERGVPFYGSSFSGKPKTRIEGFSSGNNESGCIVSARA